MKRLSLLLCLFLATSLHAQITVGDAIPAAAQDAAKQLLRDASPKAMVLNVGEFEEIDPAKSIVDPLLFLPTNPELVTRIDVAANQPIAIWMTRKGEKAPKLHQFAAKPYAWFIVIAAKPGTGSIFFIKNGAAGKSPTVADTLEVTVPGVTPQPPGPQPPGPQPPGPGPIPQPGLRVLFVLESKDLALLPSAQNQMLSSKAVTDYLNSHCVKENGHPEWRRYDPSTEGETEVWKAAMARPRASVPWIVIGNGKDSGYEGPLPANKDALLTLLKTYGGP